MEANSDSMQIAVTAPINIALIKYWGKKDSKLMLPVNDSISLGIDALFAKTTVTARKRAHNSSPCADKVLVNGKEMDLGGSENRYTRCFQEVRRIQRKRKSGESLPVKWDFEVLLTGP